MNPIEAYWSQTRTVKETMEGGWSRNVIDYSISYSEIFVPIAEVALLLWTIGFTAYVLIEGNS